MTTRYAVASTAPTDAQINNLIAARDIITNRRDAIETSRAVDFIDAVLRDVPPGQRSDVDALLGRPRNWMPMTRDADLEHAEQIIAARAPATGKRVVMVSVDTDEKTFATADPEWLAMQPGESEADYIARIWPAIPEEAY